MPIKLTSTVPLDKESQAWLNKAEKHINEQEDKCNFDLINFGQSITYISEPMQDYIQGASLDPPVLLPSILEAIYNQDPLVIAELGMDFNYHDLTQWITQNRALVKAMLSEINHEILKDDIL